MLGRENLVRNISLAFPGKRSDTIIRMMENINRGIQKYFLVKTLISLGIGLLATLVLIIFDVDFAWVWGLLAFLLNFIPNIGAVIATIPPILVAIFQYGGFLPAIWIALILTLSHVIWGNILEPAFMGKSLNISPLVIIISLIFWGYIWGPVGMVLAVPISSTILIFCSNIESLKPISILIAEE
jgi:predicted PurR-regulated permease PerM